MLSVDLSFQLARGQRPEPRQLIPRGVVNGRTVRKRRLLVIEIGCMMVGWGSNREFRGLCEIDFMDVSLSLNFRGSWGSFLCFDGRISVSLERG